MRSVDLIEILIYGGEKLFRRQIVRTRVNK